MTSEAEQAATSLFGQPYLDQLCCRMRPRPRADLPAAAGDAVRQPARQGVPAEVTMVRRLPRQSFRIALEDLVADRRQALAKDFPHIRMLPRPLDDLGHCMLVDVAD